MSTPEAARLDATASAAKHDEGDSDSEQVAGSKGGRGGWAAALENIELEDQTAGSRALVAIPEPPRPPPPPVKPRGGVDATTAQLMSNPMALQVAMMMIQQMMMLHSMGMPMREAQVSPGQAALPHMPPPLPSAPPGPVSEEGIKKVKEYQRLMKKGDNMETVFVGGLRKSTDEDQVFSHFSKFGEVEKVEIKRQGDGTSRGFAFVRFKNKGAVDQVIEKRAAHMIDNKWIDVKRHNGVAACAGRATSLANDDVKEQDEPKQKETVDTEEDFTSKYLSMAQQLAVEEQQKQGASPSVPEGQGMVAMVPVAPVVGPGMVMAPMMPQMMGQPQAMMNGSMSGMTGMMIPAPGAGPGYRGPCGPGPCALGPYGPYGPPCVGGPCGGGGPCGLSPCNGGYGSYGPSGPYGVPPRPGPYGKGMW